MIELDQMKLELQQYEKPLEEVRDSLDLDFKKQRIEELSRESEAPDFWSNADVANKKMKQLKDLQNLVEEADGTRLEGVFKEGFRTGTFTVMDKTGKKIRTIIY